MPSRDLPSSPLLWAPPPLVHRHNHSLTAPLAGGIAAAAAAASLLILFALCFRKISLKTDSDSDSRPPYRFSYSVLRRATSKLDPSLRLGQGGFGSVYSGTLKIPGSKSDVPVAVKVMDSGSLQGEREFQNELFFAGKMDSKYIVSVVGFSAADRRGRRMMLVYELMANGSLQDCLLHRKCSELKNWENRFSIALDIAKGLEYLHHFCDPPVIHGDIKPSNVLLDTNFNAKIGDFGLAKVKTEDRVEIEVKKEQTLVEDNNGSVIEEFHGGVDQLPETPVVSPETVAAMASPSEGFDKTSVLEGNFDRFSVESGKMSDKKGGVKKKKKGNDWWWKQEIAEAESGPVKDYVMEWIGNEIKEERPTSEWIGASSSSGEHRRPAREWWKEEYCEELAMKKKGSTSDDCHSDYWARDDELYGDRKNKKMSRSRSRRSSKSSIDWWLDGVSSELWRARRNSFDSASASGEIAKSGVSSTPSLRGTVCYVAPEYGVCGDLSEKCDVYSYGVVLLVLIAGRRPLQVTSSPLSEFRRANLLSWSRHLARAGKLLDLVDQSLELVNQEQALLCITVALRCLQKSPARRPSMKEVVGMLSGDLEPPQLPPELSPSPPSHSKYKPHKKRISGDI
nr:receptor-like serine/threonine-protein kinase At4g25390 [Ipomoea batatas]GMC78848.1 receptor-like serine/threonine-protein kinase At4g25390 [Ipomoea batatas]GMD12949.1 receptor-like serine/threonine-protein kinase At4g25390 [Ipomoea batatas]GMD19244.1 receptor-like serine/threonine-protein kinase At4g25390 [Ipomoea batatas]GME13130.1 receptor-like serine/threonine-protein kinase At4g25390 [Ipomoea batatas]